MTERKFKLPMPGDWVRFYRSGGMVIGVVQYAQPGDRWPHAWTLLTDLGAVEVDLEVRYAP